MPLGLISGLWGKDTMKSLTKTPLILATAYDADNPMPEIMSCGVEQLGLDVLRLPLRQVLRRRYPRHITPVVHLHWIGHLFRPQSVAASATVTAKYLALLTIAKLRRFKIVWTLHNESSHESRHPQIERAVRKLLIRSFADTIVVMTRQSAADFEARHGRSTARKVRYVPHPTYSSFYGPALPKSEARDRLGLPANVPVFLFFGRVRAYKGALALIRAFTRLDGNARLVIAGACEPDDELAICEAAAADTRICLQLERVRNDDVANLVTASDWVTLPYEEVSNSGVLLLALTFARPVIAPDAPTLVEVLGPTLAQACYQRGSQDSLEQSLQLAFSRHADQTTWEQNARSRACDFDVQVCAKHLFDVYHDVVSQ